MTDGRKIGRAQLFAIFFISRVTALFTFIAPRTTPFEPGDRLLLFFSFFMFSALFAVPVFLVTKNGSSITSATDRLSPVLTKALAAVYIAALLWNAGVSTAKFELFMTTAMFSGAVLLPFTALMLLACVYIALKGTQTIGRCCTVVLAAFFLSVAAIIASTLGDFDILNLTPPLRDGVLPVLKNGFAAAARTPEAGVLLFIQPEVNGKIRKSYLAWLAVFGLFAAAALTVIAGITGRYGDEQMFPLYALTVLAKFGPFEKADDVLTGLWVLCSMFRTAFYIALTAGIANRVFQIKNKILTYFISGACVLCVYFLLSQSVELLSGVLSSGINELLFTLLAGIVPLGVYAACRRKSAPGQP